MQNRIEADSKYQWGNKMLAKPSIENILSAINYYTRSLLFLRSIEKADVTHEDNKKIQMVHEALLKGINQLLSLSSDWSQVVDTLEKFLIFYVDSYKILNKTNQRLPRLDTLELKIGGSFTKLSANAPSKPEKERLTNYLAVISLFHEDLTTEKNHTLSSDDPIVIKSFELYKRALKICEATVKIDSPATEEKPRPEKISPPAAALKSSTTQEQKETAALMQAKWLKGHPALNPGVKTEHEPVQKRRKEADTSNSSPAFSGSNK